MSMRIGDTVFIDGLEPNYAPLPPDWPIAPAIVVPVEAILDMHPGGVIRVRNNHSSGHWPLAPLIPNRLYGAAINEDGDAM